MDTKPFLAACRNQHAADNSANIVCVCVCVYVSVIGGRVCRAHVFNFLCYKKYHCAKEESLQPCPPLTPPPWVCSTWWSLF